MQPRSQAFCAARNRCWSARYEYSKSAMAKHTNATTTPTVYLRNRRILLPAELLIPQDRIARPLRHISQHSLLDLRRPNGESPRSDGDLAITRHHA